MSPVKLISKLISRIVKPSSMDKTEAKPYFRVRFRWWKPFDIDGLVGDVGDKYDVDPRPDFNSEGRIEVFADVRKEIRVKADTLHVFLTAYRAILMQKEAAPLTEKDRKLEKFILERYTHVRDTPFI